MSSLVGNYIVNELPVKIIDKGDGSISILFYDGHKKEFIRSPQFLSMIMYGREDIKKVTDEELNTYIRETF
jgi:hypothetical protein